MVVSENINISDTSRISIKIHNTFPYFTVALFFSSAESEDLAVHLYPGAVTIQGVLRRKTLLKEGKKPTVSY